ncbi:CPBP family intramembrane glutamic endopeptidase [Actinomadura bangladeshensis]|uniref:CPBP family intramembrane metalloprotease n=1 Tax=Actinomadura bangladeshensis TaxID=453573 RepID=A0A4R4P4U1_9ACTN|nr:CPBP family intramembrane glutamic endopeptidase [Actinomadura bangladeshensis]TDC17075.1 CPBP family intramembrane metalloprotease [Actinomadura bangladeshensis]
MSEPGESSGGWAPPDAAVPVPEPGRPEQPQPYPQPWYAEPQYAEPQYAQPQYEQPAQQAQPYGGAGPEPEYVPGMPYWPGAPAQPGPYSQAPYGPGPYGPGYGYGMPPAKRPWTVPPPEGRPYHQAARDEAHRWWRPLLGSLVLLVGGFGLAIPLMAVGMIVNALVTGDAPDPTATDTDSLFGNDTADLAFNLGSLALFLPVALGVAWLVQRRRPGTLSSVAGRLRWRWMLVCCGLAIAFCVVSYGTSVVAAIAMDDRSGADEHWVGWGRFLAPAIVIILLVPFQSAAEEYVFRGWLLQAVGACTLENARSRVGRAFSAVLRTPWPGIVLGSALFTAGHGYTSWGILDIFLFGAIAAWLAVRTGGLESSIALHVFNNLMAFLLPAAVGKLDIEQGGVPWQVVAADVVPMALYAAVVVLLARRMRVQRITAGGGVPVVPEPEPEPVQMPEDAAVTGRPTA